MRFRIDRHYYFHFEKDETLEALHSINSKLQKIMLNQTELAQQITQLTEQINKSKAEITGKLADLETALANAGNTTPEVDAALTALKTAVQGVDDIVPDGQPAEPETPQA